MAILMEFFSARPGVVTLVRPGAPASVDCLMTAYEPLCYDVVCEFLPLHARAAEVGCFKGGSACILWHGMTRRGKGVTLACHDLFEPYRVGDETHDIERCFDDNLAAFDAHAIKVKGDSKETHAVHPDGCLDYCFIDGDHSFEGTLADIRNFLPKLREDGWMLVQDCVPGGEVDRALRDAVPPHLPRIVVQPPFGHYVTIIHRTRLADYHARIVQVMEAASAQQSGNRMFPGTS